MWDANLLSTDKGKADPLLASRVDGMIRTMNTFNVLFPNYDSSYNVNLNNVKTIETVIIFPINVDNGDTISYTFLNNILTLNRSNPITQDMNVRIVVYGYTTAY